jgi:hypothetical protein
MLPVAAAASNNAVNDPSARGLPSFLHDNVIDYSSSLYNSNLAKIKYCTGKIKSKNERIQAGNELFIATSSSHQDIHEDVIMNILITSTP